GHTGRLSDLAYTPDGKRIATLSYRQSEQKVEVKLWDANTGRELLTLLTDGPSRLGNSRLYFSSDGHRLTYAYRTRPGAEEIETTWDATPMPERPAAK